MKNIGEFFRDLFVPRTWKIIDTVNMHCDGKNIGRKFLLQDQYGNIKVKHDYPHKFYY